MTPLAWVALGFIAGVIVTLLFLWAYLETMDRLLAEEAEKGRPSRAPDGGAAGQRAPSDEGALE